MQAYAQDKDALVRALDTNEKTGLTDEQAAAARAQYGANRLREKKKKTMLARFLDQFKDAMILILIAAAVVSFVIAINGHDKAEFFEPILILAIVVVNAIMGVMQESKAERALDALKNMSAPHARVLRGGVARVLDAAELVPGDVVHLEAGDFVPADARLLESSSLKAEESALTGESVPVEKRANAVVPEDAALGDRVNMVYSGCAISYGSATAVVTAIGMETEMGRIANLLDNEQEEMTPLQKKLAELGKYLGFVALAACGVIFVVGLMNGIPVMEIFMTAVSLAVSAIPEGLPAIVTIVLSIGVERMVRRNAIIRQLPAVETLGSASVICSDKTGTLTQNRMTLTKAYLYGAPESADITDRCAPDVLELIRLAALCCDGEVSVVNDEEKHIGDPTETSIIAAAMHNGVDMARLRDEYPRVAGIPFDSERKRMTTIHKIGGKYLAIVKGAYDMMADRCVRQDLTMAQTMVEAMSTQALRVLAVGTREFDAIPESLDPDQVERDLTFVGLVGMIDPPREEVKAAVAVCRNAGIRPVMITGDHVVTAGAIAKALGILLDGDRAITGAQLDRMTDGQLDSEVEHIAVYARVSPENKIRIVKAWQRRGQVVAMTGDGVNDAPALKAADIGCAMGITGTDVAKGAADMTLTDDNFTTIVDAVREGRGIYANIRKVVGFLLGTNIGEVITVFTAMMVWHESPLLSMQLLWINLVTDGLPAVALGMEAVEDDVMDNPPRPKNEGIFAHGYGLRIILQGVMFAILSLAAYVIGRADSVADGRTMAFVVLALSQVVQAYNMRSERSLFKTGFFTNRALNGACLASVVLVALVLFTPAASLFMLTALSTDRLLIALGLAITPLVVMEIAKALIAARTKR